MGGVCRHWHNGVGYVRMGITCRHEHTCVHAHVIWNPESKQLDLRWDVATELIPVQVQTVQLRESANLPQAAAHPTPASAPESSQVPDPRPKPGAPQAFWSPGIPFNHHAHPIPMPAPTCHATLFKAHSVRPIHTTSTPLSFNRNPRVNANGTSSRSQPIQRSASWELGKRKLRPQVHSFGCVGGWA